MEVSPNDVTPKIVTPKSCYWVGQHNLLTSFLFVLLKPFHRTKLSCYDVYKIFQTEPRLLEADIDLVMEEMGRLMPGRDPCDLIARDPNLVLSMNNAGLHSSLFIDDGISQF
jgi:hypothetical protein